MPAERLRFDIEFIAIILGAIAFSYIVSDQLVSNALTSALLVVLFFLIGLHMDRREVYRHLHKKKEMVTGLIAIYMIAPTIGLFFYVGFPGDIGKSIMIVAISAASLGASVVWTNRAKGDGGTALVTGSLSMLLAFIFVPLWVFQVEGSTEVLDFMLRNIWIIAIPLVAGFLSQRLHITVVEDLRNNFSKLGTGLIVFLLFFQFIEYSGEELISPTELVLSIVLMSIFILVTFILSYIFSKATGLSEKQSRAIGFVTSVKAFAVALFIALQFGSRVIQFVTVYYFVSRIIGGLIAQYFRKGSLVKVVKQYAQSIKSAADIR